MRLEDELYLTGIHVEAARDDQLLEATADGERSIGTDLAHVRGAKEAIRCEGFGGCLRVAPIASEDLAALEQHLVALAELHLDSRERQPDAAGLPRAVVRVGDHDAALGDPVALDRRLAQQPGASLEQGRGQRRGPGYENPYMRQVGRMLVQPVAQTLVHGGHAKEHGAALGVVPGQLGHHRLRRELHQRRAAAAQQGSMESHAQAVQVEQRQGVDQDVPGRPVPHLNRAAGLCQHAAMLEDGPLGSSCRSRRVEDQGRIVWADRGHRGRLALGQVLERHHTPAQLSHDHCSLDVRDDHCRVRIGDYVLGFGGAIVRVHRHDAGAGSKRAQVCHHPVERVGGIQPDSISWLDSHRVQAARDLLRA